MSFLGLGRTADRQPPSSFMSTEYQGPFSSARNWTWALPTDAAGVKHASSFGNSPATTQPTSLWAMTGRSPFQGAAGGSAVVAAGAAGRGGGALAAPGVVDARARPGLPEPS